MNSLEDFSDQQIIQEYERRRMLILNGFCTYCKLSRGSCKCRMKGDSGMVHSTMTPNGGPGHLGGPLLSVVFGNGHGQIIR